MRTVHTVSSYLIHRLYAHGVRHIFGVPGDYVLGFFHELERSKLQVINTCDEQGAGFAADAYARVSGLGVVCVCVNPGQETIIMKISKKNYKEWLEVRDDTVSL